MIWSLFRTPRRQPADVEAEILSLCHDSQMRHLTTGARHGACLDCGSITKETRKR